MEYECPRCGYTTKQRCNYVYHVVKRIKPCPPLKANISLDNIKADFEVIQKCYACNTCSKSYASRSGLMYHKKECNNVTRDIATLQQQVEHLMTENKRITEELDHVKHEKGTTITANGENIQAANTIMNIHIHVCDFGKENLEHITEEFAKQCLSKGHHGIVPMIDKIYFNKEHPENHNIQLTSLKHGVVEVHKDNKWVPQGLHETIDTMIVKSSSEIINRVAPIMEVNEDTVHNISSISNMNSSHKKKIKECTKGKLIARRKFTST